MSTKKSVLETQINDVLVHQNRLLKEIQFPKTDDIDTCISKSEELLKSLHINTLSDSKKIQINNYYQKVVILPSWDSLCKEAENHVGTGHDLEVLFTPEELQLNRIKIKELNKEYNNIHKLDEFDIGIAALAGLVGALIDILLVGIPVKTNNGLNAGPLSNYIRDYFEKKFPKEEMDKLANSKKCKVPFDAQDNRHTKINIVGLSAYYHRLLQLGHDPVLGLVFGVLDILNGTMTTIDKNGKIVCQVMENYADRKESDVFSAIFKLLLHFKSDITTSMGLPAPMMSLFNLLQFGSIGKEEQTIAEIVQGMYYEGYDFIHFCSMSVPAMITEIIVRLGYSIKRIKEGHSVSESIPFSLDREKNPKLSTMLFIGHSAEVAINAGKVVFTENPMAINYSQWIAFAKYSYSQLKWGLITKPKLRDEYVLGKVHDELNEVLVDIDKSFDDFSKERYVMVLN